MADNHLLEGDPAKLLAARLFSYRGPPIAVDPALLTPRAIRGLFHRNYATLEEAIAEAKRRSAARRVQ